MSFKFGKRSKASLQTCHPDLRIIHETGIKDIRIDYGIHQGGRTFVEQLGYFIARKSQLDPRNPNQLVKAMHVITEDRPLSMATDIHVAAKYNGKSLAWNAIHLTYVAAYLIATADRLYDEGKITHKLRWGGNWDMDSVIQLDQSFDDNPHLELY